MLGLLPRDRAGSVDWVAATREGIVRPRAAAPGQATDSTLVFPFDIYLEGSGGPEAYFPHSVHQEWLSCQSCHPTVYRRGAIAGSADQTHGPASCGKCHNGVAFPVGSCERCHALAQDLPRDRLAPTFGETYEMSRGPQQYYENSDGGSYGPGAELYPPARFPHGLHRVRFQCRACHEKPFVMERGATLLSQQEAHGVDGCGVCHDGSTAFDTGLDDCYRCHLENSGAPREER